MEFYSVKLHSIRTIRIKVNTDIIFFKIPVMLVMKNTANNTMYIVQELHTFL